MTNRDVKTADYFSTETDLHPRGSQPLLHQRGVEIQRFGTVRLMPISLSYEARMESCQLLNHVLADSMILYSLYKKHHWLVRGHTFYQLHLLLDKHAAEHLELIDLIAERVQTLGGIAIADPRHVAEVTGIRRPPDGAEEVPAMLSRLLDAHELIISSIRDAITATGKNRDDGTNDLLGEVLRRHELHVWFLAEHLVDTPATCRSLRVEPERKPNGWGGTDIKYEGALTEAADDRQNHEASVAAAIAAAHGDERLGYYTAGAAVPRRYLQLLVGHGDNTLTDGDQRTLVGEPDDEPKGERDCQQCGQAYNVEDGDVVNGYGG